LNESLPLKPLTLSTRQGITTGNDLQWKARNVYGKQN